MRIECPECSQRFNAPDTLMGKTVECGACDHQFKCDDQVTVKAKDKKYAGEKRGAGLDRFGNHTAEVAAPMGFKEAHYDPNVNMAQMEPLRPRRKLAIMAGIGVMLVVVIVFLLAGGETGTMRDMETSNRFVLTGFAALLGGWLIIYGMVHKRGVGVLLALIMGGAVCALPVVFPGNPLKSTAKSYDSSSESSEVKVIELSPEEAHTNYMREIGYGPVEEAIFGGSESQVGAIFLRDVSITYKDKVKNFMYDSMGEENRGILYERGDDDEHGLLVFSKLSITFDELKELCSGIGNINKVMEEQRIIDISVSESTFNGDYDSASLDEDNPKFQYANLTNLRSIDPIEKLNAVKRLGNSEPVAFRHDVVQEIIKQLPESNSELQLAMIKTLRTWSEPGEGAEPVVLEVVRKLFLEDSVSKDSMEFLIERGVEEAPLILIALWDKDPLRWADLFLETGSAAEQLLLPNLGDMDILHLTSATDVLGEVGSKAAIPLLIKVKEAKEGQSAKTLQAAIDEIQNRL